MQKQLIQYCRNRNWTVRRCRTTITLPFIGTIWLPAFMSDEFVFISPKGRVYEAAGVLMKKFIDRQKKEQKQADKHRQNPTRTPF